MRKITTATLGLLLTSTLMSISGPSDPTSALNTGDKFKHKIKQCKGAPDGEPHIHCKGFGRECATKS